MRTPTLAVRVQLLLRWNTYILFNSDIMNFVWKIDDRETESIAFLIFVLYQRFNRRWVKGGGVVQEAESIVFFKTNCSLVVL